MVSAVRAKIAGNGIVRATMDGRARSYQPRTAVSDGTIAVGLCPYGATSGASAGSCLWVPAILALAMDFISGDGVSIVCGPGIAQSLFPNSSLTLRSE